MFTAEHPVFVHAPEHAHRAPPVAVARQPRPASGRTGNRRVSNSGEHQKLLNQYAAQEHTSSESDDSVISTKLVYTQQKLFWQIKGTIDFHLFEHIDSEPCILELVPFDKNTGAELEHIYLNRALILPRVQSEVQRRLEQKQAALKPVRSRSGKSGSGKQTSGSGKLQSLQSLSSFTEPGGSSSSSDGIILEDMTNEVIGEFVLARTLVVPSDGVSTDRLKIRIKQTSSEMADPTKLSIIALKPSGKSDLTIARPRRPSYVEFDSVLQSFQSDSEGLGHAVSSASLYSAKSTEAFENFEVIKARPRSMSIDELKDLELRARRGREEPVLTAKERWLQTIRTIHAKRNPDNASASASSPVPDRAISQSPSPGHRSRAGRETFPNPGSPSPPTWTPTTFSPAQSRAQRQTGASAANTWNGGTRASPLRGSVSSNNSSPSEKPPTHLPPRHSWNNASPSRARRGDESVGLGGSGGLGIAPHVSPARASSPLLLAKQ
jgi:hypothetical protein